MTPEPMQAQVPISPLPSNWSINVAEVNGQQFVLVQFSGPAGVNFVWFTPDAADDFARSIREHAAKSRLAIAKAVPTAEQVQEATQAITELRRNGGSRAERRRRR